MTKEQKEHLEFLSHSEKENDKVFKQMIPYMANNYNPEYKALVKDTPLENLSNNSKDVMMKSLMKMYGNRYHAFRDAWVNLFGSSKATPFKQTPKSVLEEFMNDAINSKKLAFKNDYAGKWLSNKYANEMNLGKTGSKKV